MRILVWEVMKGWVHPPPLEAKLAEEMQLTVQELNSAEQTILEQRYLRHMALAKIKALEDWHHGRVREGQKTQPIEPRKE